MERLFAPGRLYPYRPLALLWGLLLLGATAVPTGPAALPLAADIDQIIRETQTEAALWGIYVKDLQSGTVLYTRNADKVFLPASNQKLLTSATALDALGRDHRFETTLYFNGAIEGTTMQGDLILRGSGDPTFGSRSIRLDDPLQEWAAQLAEMGVRRFEGRILGDDDVFVDAPYAEGWDVSLVARQSFAPPSGGLAYRDNLSSVQIRAGKAGQQALVETIPPGYLEVRNRLTTHGRRRGRSVSVDRPIGVEQLTLSGSVHRSYRATIDVPVANPTAFTLHSFRAHLEAAGITVAAEVVDVDDLTTKPNYQAAEPLFVALSPPLPELLAVVNKESDNFFAEQLFRAFGWGGSPDGGERRVKALLERAGADASSLSIRDGSGLSRKDLVTPEALGTLLAYMNTHVDRDVFMASLAGGGERRTTLQYRLHDLPIQAKTGSLEYVRALSGYATAQNGHRLAFVVMVNNYTAPSARITQTIDQIVTTLTASPTG